MIPNAITIQVRQGSPSIYVSRVKDATPHFPYRGTSPDEAIGHLMRELWLGGGFDQPVLIDFDIQSDSPTTRY